jgi:NADPH:quinone reductase-like Zn-dependent oxidoreductase
MQAPGVAMVQVPQRMKAIDPDGPGGPEVLRVVERAVPVPAPSEVLIRVAAAGVNRPDVMQREGRYPPPPGAPSIPGLEIAGTVVASGPGLEGNLVGRPVCALIAGGGYAEYAVARAHFSSEPAVTMTVRPKSRPSRIAMVPMPLVPPWTSTVSPSTA